MKHYTLYPAQQLVVDKAIGRSRLIIGDCGVGKTLLAKKLCDGHRAVVVTPASVVDQMKEYFNNDLVISHSKFIMAKHLKETVAPFIDSCKEGCILVIDESAILKSPQNKISKVCIKIKELFKHIYLFSALPFPNSLLEAWVTSVLCGMPLDDNYNSFTMKYSKLVRGKESIPNTGFNRRHYLKFGFKPVIINSDDLMKRITEFTIYLRREDISPNLPSRIFMHRTFDYTPEQTRCVASIRKENVALIGLDEFPLTSAMAVAQKLAQVESAFYYTEEGATVWLKGKKLTCLLSLLEEIGEEKVIIFTQYKAEKDQIIKNIKSSTDSPEAFKSGAFQYLVGHPLSIGVGVSLEIANICIFFSNSFSWDQRLQSLGRIDRITQKRTCLYYDLIPSHGGVAKKVLNALNEKRSLTEVIKSVLN